MGCIQINLGLRLKLPPQRVIRVWVINVLQAESQQVPWQFCSAGGPSLQIGCRVPLAADCGAVRGRRRWQATPRLPPRTAPACKSPAPRRLRAAARYGGEQPPGRPDTAGSVLTTTCGTRRLRGGPIGVAAPPSLRPRPRPCSPTPRLLAVVDHIHQEPMQHCCGGERQLLIRGTKTSDHACAVTGNTLFEFKNAAGTEDANSKQIRTGFEFESASGL